jgi:hypothetical protein
MCIETLIGYGCFAAIIIGGIINLLITRINWNLHIFYFRLWLRRAL